VLFALTCLQMLKPSDTFAPTLSPAGLGACVGSACRLRPQPAAAVALDASRRLELRGFKGFPQPQGRAGSVAGGMEMLSAKDQHRNLIKDFLNQRAVQTLLHNYDQVGDRINYQFLESFEEHEGLRNLHGYGAMKTSWDEYLTKLLRTPDIHIKQKVASYRGGSSGNPYLKDMSVTVEHVIQPNEMAKTLMGLRATLSKEWVADLQLISLENAELWRHHLAMVTNQTDPESESKHRLLQLSDQCSPLRMSNYDLLEKFCTHIACEKVIADLSQKEERCAIWLREKLISAGMSQTNDNYKRGVAREFLYQTLNEAPRVVAAIEEDGTESLTLIDPLDMAEKIMDERLKCAEEWVSLLEEVEEDHLELKRSFLIKCLSMERQELEIDNE